jgi:LPS-assembly lipoprotein
MLMLKMHTNRRPLLALILLALAILAMLSACGFRLRNAEQTNLPFKTIYLGFTENSALGIELKRNIRANGSTAIVTDRKLAEAIVEVVQPEKEEQVELSRNGQGQPVEYTLYYKFSFRVRDNKDRELLPATPITITRYLPFNAALALAKETEKQGIYRDMQTDMAQQIVRRLAALKPIE